VVIQILRQASYLVLKNFHCLLFSNYTKYDKFWVFAPTPVVELATLPERMKNNAKKVKLLRYGPTEQCRRYHGQHKGQTDGAGEDWYQQNAQDRCIKEVKMFLATL